MMLKKTKSKKKARTCRLKSKLKARYKKRRKASKHGKHEKSTDQYPV